MERFLAELARLNPEQKRAVETIDGPVLVVAGPGTGKTQILAARAGYILQNTDTPHESILCLTYTDAGTLAMRKRLIEFIGPDAFRIPIHTFHSFCNLVIQENRSFFGLGELNPASELQRIEIAHEIIDSFADDHPLKKWTGDIYYNTGRLLKLFDIMKMENFSVAFIIQKIEEYLSQLPDREEFQYKRANSKRDIKAGDPNMGKIAEATDKMNELQAAAEAFPLYEKKLAQRHCYDFSDMILWVIHQFKSKEQLLLRYQEKYLYVMVDEYQDTSGSQNTLLDLLLNYWEEPNVFVVGDDDQSIYRFQGANIENILNFAQQYPSMETIVLAENYRSTQQILDASMGLIGRNTERLVTQLEQLNKQLVAKHPDRTFPGKTPQVKEFVNDLQESAWVAKAVEDASKQGKPLNEMAILYRNHKQCDDIVRYFQHKKIPYNIRRRNDVLKSPFLLQILNMLHYVAEELKAPFSGDHRLFSMMHYPWFEIAAADIAAFALDMRKAPKEQGKYWRDALAAIKAPNNPGLFDSQGMSEKMRFHHFSKLIEGWIQHYHNQTLQAFFEQMLTNSGILAYVMKQEEQISLLEELRTFFDYIKEETHRNPGLSLNDLLDTLSLMADYDISLAQEKLSIQENGVNLITVHSAKGLEFDVVYLLGCDKSIWQGANRSGTFSFPDNISKKAEEGTDLEESRRLFYVAMTRAKEELIISYAIAKNDGKLKERSQFVEEVIDATTIEAEKVEVEDDFLLAFGLQSMEEAPAAVARLADPERLRAALQGYQLSVTHLNTYLKCPQSFYFNYVLQVPLARHPSMEFGSAVHEALFHYFEQMQNSESQEFPPQEELLRLFDRELYIRREAFTPKEFEQKSAYAHKFLPEYHRENIHRWNKIVALERHINNVVVEGVPVKGVLDKLEFEGNNAHVIDYKTGRYEYARSKFLRPTDVPKNPLEPTFEEQFGGDYWRQGVYYKLLVSNYKERKWNVISTRFDFVEPDRKTGTFYSESVEVSTEDMEIVKAQIKETYQGIQNLEFDKGCNKPDCFWCTFVKNQFKRPVADELSAISE